jgi:hypothetical protein
VCCCCSIKPDKIIFHAPYEPDGLFAPESCDPAVLFVVVSLRQCMQANGGSGVGTSWSCTSAFAFRFDYGLASPCFGVWMQRDASV